MTAPPTLITVDELSALLAADRPPTLLDVRWRLGGPPGRELYQAGHIPGAAFVDLDLELAASRAPADAIRCRRPTTSRRRCAGPG